MPPKKGKKISLNEFLGDTALGSWSDEMDALPNAPAVRTDEEMARANDRYGRRDDFLSTRPDRVSGPPREDLPLPTQPPYTAYIGNLAFDLTEMELEDLFSPAKTKSIKIIKDRDEKPKGFGYVEFVDLDGLKDALTKSGTSFSGRTIRVSVAEPPKERGGFGGFDDDAKFENPWRRDGPLPDLPNSRDSSRRRFDSPSTGDRPAGVSEGASDWRSSRPARSVAPEPDLAPSFKRKTSNFAVSDAGTADKEEVWTIGGKFKPTATGPSDDSGGKFGSVRGRGDMGPPRDPAIAEEADWRSSARPRPATRGSTSPTSSTPPTPQIGRRKLELLPRSGNVSTTPSPLSSPKMIPTPAIIHNASRASPFGAAKPVDVSSREKEVTERLEKDKDRLSHTMSRTSSRTATERSPLTRIATPPLTGSTTPTTPTSPKHSAPAVANVRPTLSFANAAANKGAATGDVAGEKNERETKEVDQIDQTTEKVAEIEI